MIREGKTAGPCYQRVGGNKTNYSAGARETGNEKGLRSARGFTAPLSLSLSLSRALLSLSNYLIAIRFISIFIDSTSLIYFSQFTTSRTTIQPPDPIHVNGRG